jgi:hypothetical protein
MSNENVVDEKVQQIYASFWKKISHSEGGNRTKLIEQKQLVTERVKATP